MTVKEYMMTFPNTDRYEKATKELMAKKARENNLGQKRSLEAKMAMSLARKRGIAEGRIVTPFMSMNKMGSNNPAWGSKYHSVEEIENLRNRKSKIFSDLITNNKINLLTYKRGKFYSDKMNTEFYCRSKLELEVSKLFEEYDFITQYIHEPFSITYTYEGKRHRYIPDYLVTISDGSKILVEVGSIGYKKFRDTRFKEKVEAGKKFCLDKKYSFVFLTDQTLSKLENEKNSINCWDHLKALCHNIVGNDKCEGLKS